MKEVFVYLIDVVFLDNMKFVIFIRVVEIVNGKVLFEVFGGIMVEIVVLIVEMGVDLILVGWIIYSVLCFDVGFDFEFVDWSLIFVCSLSLEIILVGFYNNLSCWCDCDFVKNWGVN